MKFGLPVASGFEFSQEPERVRPQKFATHRTRKASESNAMAPIDDAVVTSPCHDALAGLPAVQTREERVAVLINRDSGLKCSPGLQCRAEVHAQTSERNDFPVLLTLVSTHARRDETCEPI